MCRETIFGSDAVVRRDCLWIDQNRKQLRLPGPHYVDLVMSWVQGLVDDETIFPTKSGVFLFPVHLATRELTIIG